MRSNSLPHHRLTNALDTKDITASDRVLELGPDT